ncbi:MAG: hypothetical protein VKL39_04865 [Leptolyngbyaceae bacterium]|nr:hypothetical protein [Leptolyngbyaceae bacterium]
MKALFYASLLSGVLMGCSTAQPTLESSAESTQADPAVLMATPENADETDVEETTIQIAKRFQQGPLVLDIQEVQLSSKQIAVHVEIANDSSRLIRFYPNQGRLSTGVDELKANIFLTDDSLSGVLDPQEQKSGVLIFSSRFEEELDFSNVRSLQLSLGQVIDMASIDPEQVNIAFSLDPAS